DSSSTNLALFSTRPLGCIALQATALRSARSRPGQVRSADRRGCTAHRALPIQDQAEELLERAIQHQQAALDIFEAKIGSPEWVGRIRLSDHMKDLERRSKFSTDLRVRFANADLNLSMEGWNRTDEDADLLIQRAQMDSHYR